MKWILNLIYWLDKNEKFIIDWVQLRFYICSLLDFKNKERRELFRKVRKNTLVSYGRLASLWNLILKIEKRNLKGNLVECGVWKGGCAATIGYLMQKYEMKGELYLFDSFEGMPEPTEKDGNKAKVFAGGKDKGELKSIKKTIGLLKTVKKLFFDEIKLDKKKIHFYKGWFQKTLPKAKKKVGPIVLLRIDSDWYESVKICLEELYDQVVKGGCVVFDDYHYWPGCKMAVDEFMEERKIKSKLKRTGFSGVFWQK